MPLQKKPSTPSIMRQYSTNTFQSQEENDRMFPHAGMKCGAYPAAARKVPAAASLRGEPAPRNCRFIIIRIAASGRRFAVCHPAQIGCAVPPQFLAVYPIDFRRRSCYNKCVRSKRQTHRHTDVLLLKRFSFASAFLFRRGVLTYAGAGRKDPP